MPNVVIDTTDAQEHLGVVGAKEVIEDLRIHIDLTKAAGDPADVPLTFTTHPVAQSVPGVFEVQAVMFHDNSLHAVPEEVEDGGVIDFRPDQELLGYYYLDVSVALPDLPAPQTLSETLHVDWGLGSQDVELVAYTAALTGQVLPGPSRTVTEGGIDHEPQINILVKYVCNNQETIQIEFFQVETSVPAARPVGEVQSFSLTPQLTETIRKGGVLPNPPRIEFGPPGVALREVSVTLRLGQGVGRHHGYIRLVPTNMPQLGYTDVEFTWAERE